MNAPTHGAAACRLPAGAGELWAILALAAVVALAIGASGHPALAAVVREAALPIRVVAEILYIAGATAIFHVAWFTPRGDYRLRQTLVACCCVPLIAFDLLHVLTYPGMPDFLGANQPAATAYYESLARASLPFALAALQLRSDAVVPTVGLRWSMLLAAWSCVLPVAWFGVAHPAALAQLGDDAAAAFPARLMVQAAVAGLYVAAAYLAARRGGMGRAGNRHTVLAALLAGLGQFHFIPGAEAAGIADVVSHACDLLAVNMAFLSVYADAVDAPYHLLGMSRTEALRERERMEAIFNSVAEGVIVVNADLTVMAMNPVACHLVGCSGSRLRNAPLREALGKAMGPAVAGMLAGVENALQTGQARSARGAFATWAVGDTRFVLDYSVSPVRDRSGHVSGAILALRDVTEHSRLTEKLRDGADYARGLLDAGLDPIIVIGMDGAIADANRATAQVTGRLRGGLVGEPFHSLFADPASVRSAMEGVFPDGSARLPLFVLRPDGGRTEVSCNITPYRNSSGEVCGAFATIHDVTEQRQVQLALEYQATCDALTALPNRRAFRQRVEQAAAEARSANRFVAVMIIDVDDFKDVNDALGHLVGDELIKGIASRLTLSLGEAGIVARIGGDEFAVLLASLGHPDEARPVAAKLLAAVNAPLLLDGGEVMISCSMGVSVFPLDAEDEASRLLHSADTAMHLAKESGKGNYQYFTVGMGNAVQRRIELGTHMRNALQRGEFCLHYQPQCELATGTIVGAEALLRWNAGGLGGISPAEFIPIAEDSGLILPIGDWVLRQACRDAASWRRETGRDVTVAVNISARQFRDDDIVAAVTRALDESGLPPGLLELELTESLLVRDAAGVAATLREIKKLGVSIAIDDFGTGYSSLAYLKHFPLDYLKIDRSFVMGIPGDRNDEAIVHTIVTLARNLGLEVIAEGVETAEQRAFLQQLGCREIQGHYVSRPIPGERLLALLQAGDESPAARHAAHDIGTLPCFSTAS
ncbi:MAG TPA: EAL domain-containing protein [Rhodocyclaceae bacterium]